MTKALIRLLALGVLLALAVASASPAQLEGPRNLVLVTLDGVRVQEIFGGLDLELLRRASSGSAEESDAYRKYWAPTREERRARLMPFLWRTLLREHGSIVGDERCPERLANAHRFSYPGYSELLTGRAHDDVVRSNELGQNPYPSVLEFLRRGLRARREDVAVFASWGTLARIAEHAPGTLFVNAGPARYDAEDGVVQALNRLQLDTPAESPLVRRDAYTLELALAHLRLERPRVLYVSFDETDALAHAGHYEEALDALRRIDRWLERLWTALQADSRYRDRTALVVTTDHGRGRTPEHWSEHGAGVAGAEDVWTVFAVPGNARRGVWPAGRAVRHEQLAATLAGLMGLDYRGAAPDAAPAIEAALEGPSSQGPV